MTQPGTNWIREYQFRHGRTDLWPVEEGADVWVLYICSLHWSLAQSGLATIDIYPTNWIERSFSCCVTLLWLLVHGVVFSRFVLWAQMLKDSMQEQSDQETLVRKYL